MKKSEKYVRAQSMVLSDKYNMSKTEFFKELTELAKRHLDYDGMTVETYADNELNIVITICVKKFKEVKRA